MLIVAAVMILLVLYVAALLGCTLTRYAP